VASKTNTSSSSDILESRAPLLDTDTVAAALGVTPRHIRRLVAERRIPFLEVGRFVRFDPAALNVWLDDLRVEPTRPTPRTYASCGR